MMQKLKEEITAAANRELNRANEQFPLFTSKHEGVAVAALWFIGFLKVRQAWAWLFEDWDRRF